MSSTLFAELCRVTAKMLEALAKQADQASSELVFDLRCGAETIKPLAEIILAIAASKKG